MSGCACLIVGKHPKFCRPSGVWPNETALSTSVRAKMGRFYTETALARRLWNQPEDSCEVEKARVHRRSPHRAHSSRSTLLRLAGGHRRRLLLHWPGRGKTAEGKLSLFVGVDHTSKFTVVVLAQKADMRAAAAFHRSTYLSRSVPCSPTTAPCSHTCRRSTPMPSLRPALPGPRNRIPAEQAQPSLFLDQPKPTGYRSLQTLDADSRDYPTPNTSNAGTRQLCHRLIESL